MTQQGLLTSHFGFQPNAFSNALVNNSNKIMGFGLGMVGHDSAKEAMRGAAHGMMRGTKADTVYAQEQEKQLKQQEQLNSTIQWMQQNRPDLASAVDAGMPVSEAWNLAMSPVGAKPTSAIQNFEYGLENPEFAAQQERLRKAGGTSVTTNVNPNSKVGTIPQGFELIQDPATGAYSMQPIAGGPAAMEAEAADKAAAVKQETASQYANIVTEDIDRTLDLIENNPTFTTGLGAAATSMIPGTPGFAVSKLIQTVKANAGFDRLQQMRDSSVTGGALGAINKTEMDLLQAAIGNLEQSQDAEQLKFNLTRVRDIYNRIIHGDTNPQGQTSSGVSWSIEQ